MLITTSLLILLFSWPFAFPCCKSDAGNRMNDGQWQKYTAGRIPDWLFSGLFLLLPPQTRNKNKNGSVLLIAFSALSKSWWAEKEYQNQTSVLYLFWATWKPQEMKHILVIPHNGAIPPLGKEPAVVSQQQCLGVIYLVSPFSTWRLAFWMKLVGKKP